VGLEAGASETGEPGLRERVKAPPSPELVEAYYAPAVARALRWCFAADMQVHLAHGVMLAECGIVDAAKMRPILAAVRALREAGPGALAVDHTQEDLYSYVERHIVRTLGVDVGGRLHTGRSRNDLNVTVWRMALRDALIALLGDLGRLRATLLDRAAAHAGTVMPGYTHSQHAQPITLGYYLVAFADAVARDAARLTGALGRVDACPLGAGALATTAFPIDRRRTAALLGFPDLVEVAYDAVASRDDALETVSALAVLMTGLSRLATDLQAWNTAEYGFIELDDSHSSVSSIMPQKKNPQALEYAKAAAGQVTGALVAALSSAKNTAFGDVNDGVTSLNGPVLDAVDTTAKTIRLLDAVVAKLAVRPERMLQATEDGFGTATELADTIVRETGMSFRQAHAIVARVVRDAIASGKTAGRIDVADLDAAAHAVVGRPLGLSAETVRTALDATANVAARTATGGPAPAEMARMLADRRTRLSTDEAATAAVATRLKRAGETLEDAVDGLLNAE